MAFMSSLNKWRPMNWFGLIAGVLMLALPFMGPWWQLTAGTGAADVALSPFDVSFTILGQPIHSSFIEIFLLAAKIGMVIAGGLMVAGSIMPSSWWGKHLVRYGMMKPVWTLVFLVATLLIGAVILNSILPMIMAGIAGPAGSGMVVDVSIPYLTGSSTATIQVAGAVTITAPINATLTGNFWIAVIAAVMGVMSRLYQRNFTSPTPVMELPGDSKPAMFKNETKKEGENKQKDKDGGIPKK